MSHEVESMAWTSEVPWHGLGTELKAGRTAEEWAKAAGLNWSVVRRKLYADDAKGQPRRIPNRFALVRDRDEKLMTITGHAWKPFQPAAMLAFWDEYVRAGAATMETAGSLKGGKVVWALANLKHEFTIGNKGDKVKGYLLCTSSMEVGVANRIRTTTVRVVCANTLAAAESSGVIEYSQDHRREFNIDAAREKIAKSHEALAAAEARMKVIAKLKISGDDFLNKVLMPTFGVEQGAELPKPIMEILAANEKAPGAIPGNGWGALNAVTYWADHMAGRKPEARLNNSWLGINDTRKKRVEKLLMELAA